MRQMGDWREMPEWKAAPCESMAGLSQDELKAIRANALRKRSRLFVRRLNQGTSKSEDVNSAEIVDQLTCEASKYWRETTYGFTMLLIGDRRAGCSTRFYHGTSGSARC